MKRITALLLIAALTLTALTACGKNVETEPQTTAAEPVTENAAAAETTALNEENETAAEEVSEAETSEAAEETSEAETTTQAAAPESIEEIVAFYNTAVNRVKPEAKQITRTYHHVNIPTETLELPSSIQGIGQTAIKQFVKGSDKAEVWTSREDFNLGFPVGGTGYSSKMTPDMVKTATCTDNGSTYAVKIVLKNDKLTNPKKGEGYAGVFNTVAASTFDEISIPTVTFEKVEINGSIICTIDRATQRVTDITFTETDVLDLDVKVAFSNMHAKMDLVTSDHYKIAY